MSGRFARFAECLLAGLLTVLFALPVVTAFAAFTTACTMLREERPIGLRTYTRCLAEVLRSGPIVLVVPPLVLLVLVADALAVASGVPGAGLLGAVTALAGAVVLPLGMRVAAGWRPGRRWPAVTRAAATDLVQDLRGSVLLLFAALIAVLVAVAIPITALLLPGMLALGAVAVDASARHRSTRHDVVEDASPRLKESACRLAG
ncbi:hypothetical protein Q0Z83_026400 [Actinoplanes sichuanensis]|uniref:Membrane protein YesL n=1 Tax=Actinoplanes sichuanensis TaxID=512349 RepID=A0ABW4AWC1_9ACTN|nr:hypothetical protein [Actinoplanes sichuanensis]BEL04449.1 hypothetical protein Q0Z83_026400 [Actinoplanes sichuanensis]